jgi:hypothetical protein
LNGCTNCGAVAAEVFCARCGERQPDHHDLTLRHFAHEVFHELAHVDSKLFRTLHDLVLRPGFVTVEYFAGRKSRYIAPLRLFLTLFALQFLAYSAYKPAAVYKLGTIAQTDRSGRLERGIEKVAAKKHTTREQFEEQVNERWHHALSLLQLFTIIGLALVLKMLYRQRFLAEHLVFSAHFFSFAYLLSLVMWPVYAIVGVRVNLPQFFFSFLTFTLWTIWLFRGQQRFYGASGGAAVAKTLIALLGAWLANLAIMLAALCFALYATIRA